MRSDVGEIRWTDRDLATLGWVAEQGAVSWDHLGVVLGRETGERLGYRGVQAVERRWGKAGVVESRRLLAGEGELRWTWLTDRGMRMLDRPWRGGAPAPGRLAHLWAVNEVRLFHEINWDDDWVSERELRAEARRKRYPDAAIDRDDGTRTAIEVEITPKAKGRYQPLLAALAADWPETHWYVTEPVKPVLAEALSRHRKDGGGGRFEIVDLSEVDVDDEYPTSAPVSAAGGSSGNGERDDSAGLAAVTAERDQLAADRDRLAKALKAWEARGVAADERERWRVEIRDTQIEAETKARRARGDATRQVLAANTSTGAARGDAIQAQKALSDAEAAWNWLVPWLAAWIGLGAVLGGVIVWAALNVAWNRTGGVAIVAVIFAAVGWLVWADLWDVFAERKRRHPLWCIIPTVVVLVAILVAAGWLGWLSDPAPQLPTGTPFGVPGD